MDEASKRREEQARIANEQSMQMQRESQARNLDALSEMQSKNAEVVMNLQKAQGETISELNDSFLQRDQAVRQEAKEFRDQQMTKEMEILKTSHEERQQTRESINKMVELSNDTVKSLQAQNAESLADLNRSHNENLELINQSGRERETQLLQEQREIREQQMAKESEMRNASKEEREAMRKEYEQLGKEKAEELRALNDQMQEERLAAQAKYDAKREELAEKERQLRIQMLEQEQGHSRKIEGMMQDHKNEMIEMQEKRIEDEKEHGRQLAIQYNLRLEEAADKQQKMMAMMVVYHASKENSTLVDHFSMLRTHFSNIKGMHASSAEFLATALTDDKPESWGQAKGTLRVLQLNLDRFEMARNTVLSALERNGTLTVEQKNEQKKFLDNVSKCYNAYLSNSGIIVGKLSAVPIRGIAASEMVQLNSVFQGFCSSVDAIPLLPITDGMANVVMANAQKALTNSESTLAIQDKLKNLQVQS